MPYMTVDPNHFPVHDIHDISFDETLLDLAIDVAADEMDQYTVDRFWSALYYSRIPEQVREVIDSGLVDVESFKVIPVDYDLEKQEVTILLQAAWDTGEELCMGYSLFMTLNTDGTFVDENNESKMSYSEALKPHIRQLLARTALNIAPIDPSSVY